MPAVKSTPNITLYNFSTSIKDAPKVYPSQKYFLFYGRLSYEKGVKTLLKAFRNVPDCKLKVVGTGPKENELKAFARDNNMQNVEFLGYKRGKELTDLVSNAYFVIVPSEWYENNPMTIIESYSVGTPVIGARIGGIPEIVVMCRFVPEKHLHDLVHAFVKWHEKHPERKDIKLVLAGDTDFEDDYSRGLKKMAKENGVVLTGFIKGRKLHALLTNCLCYSLPSSHEGLPISLLEAMSSRVPVIVSDIPANLEVGLPEKDYFPMGDVEALTAKLDAVLAEPAHHVEYGMSKYNWDKIAEQFAEIYRSLEK